MSQASIDILMITYNRPQYTKLALEQLLATCDEQMRVWIWQNGSDPETLAVVRSLATHPRVYRFHHSPENRKLREPTNWMWTQSTAALVSKVDDDCLLPHGWADQLREAHADVPEFGVIGCWRFAEEDFVPELAARKIRQWGRHRLLRNLWVEGSGYLMKRACRERNGLLADGESFTKYCIRLAKKGYENGWYYPFIRQEHMDDPRAPHSLLRTDADLAKFTPLSARTFGVTTLAAWCQSLRDDAIRVQEADLDPGHYIGWRANLAGLKRKLLRR